MELIRILLAILLLSMFVGINGFVLVYIERKVAGHIQRRPGPFEVGPHGILQTVADAVKLVGKQLVTPAGVDRVIFWLAPLLAFFPVFVLFLPMPFGPILTTLKVDLGLLLILAFSGINVLAICLAGWSSSNKWSLLGAARAVSQCVAYEIPMLLALLAVLYVGKPGSRGDCQSPGALAVAVERHSAADCLYSFLHRCRCGDKPKSL